MRGRLPLSILAACAAALAATPAAAEERVWHVSERAELPIAEFGVPETDDRLLSIHCDPDGTVVVVPEFYRSEPVDRTSLIVDVDGGQHTVPVSFAEDARIAAWAASATIEPDAPVIDALRRGAVANLSLLPTAPADMSPREIPLRGSARAIDEALAPCR